MEAYQIALASVVGLIFGSFGTVVSHRLVRGMDVVRGRSMCPVCGRQIAAAENIPVLSYLVQRGRCKHCGAPISARYPLAEAVTGILFGLAVWKFGLSLEAAVYAAFFWALVVLTVIDLEHKLLPNKIVYPAFVAGTIGLSAAALVNGAPERIRDLGVGALIFGGFFFVIAFIYPAGMGGGDVKLGFVLGAFLGYLGGPGVVVTGMFLSFVMGGVAGMLTIALAGGGRKTALPFGPFLALGTVVAIFVGERLFAAYMGTL
ncbi:MAG: A24 family peptidase [Actinomycetota bacterium]